MKAALNAIIDFIRREPALSLGALAALLTLAGSFGLHLGDQQQAAISALAEVVVSILIRSQVIPTVKLPASPGAPSV